MQVVYVKFSLTDGRKQKQNVCCFVCILFCFKLYKMKVQFHENITNPLVQSPSTKAVIQ